MNHRDSSWQESLRTTGITHWMAQCSPLHQSLGLRLSHPSTPWIRRRAKTPKQSKVVFPPTEFNQLQSPAPMRCPPPLNSRIRSNCGHRPEAVVSELELSLLRVLLPPLPQLPVLNSSPQLIRALDHQDPMPPCRLSNPTLPR